MLSDNEKREMLSLVRRNIEQYLDTGRTVELELKGKYLEKNGVFVTLKKHGELRGCIGFPEPHLPLGRALLDSSISAATHDPRFPPVKKEELRELKIEITILTPPKIIDSNPSDLPKHIVVGRHGLIVERGWNKGLLLPQVPVEWGWDVEEFLSQTCWKAGLPPDAWLDERTKVYKFEGEVFGEE